MAARQPAAFRAKLMPEVHRLSRSAAQPAAGRDVEAWCSRCDRVQEHVILAMVGDQIAQVRCHTCNATHKYKSGTQAAAAPRSSVPKAAAPRTTAAKAPNKAAAQESDRGLRAQWNRKMAQLDRGKAVPYTAALAPVVGQLVDHRSFGYGIVDALQDGKAQFLFEDGYRLLVTNR